MTGVGWKQGPAEDIAEDRYAGSKRKSRSFLDEGGRGQDCWKLTEMIKGQGHMGRDRRGVGIRFEEGQAEWAIGV